MTSRATFTSTPPPALKWPRSYAEASPRWQALLDWLAELQREYDAKRATEPGR
jgi:hypothetical protein